MTEGQTLHLEADGVRVHGLEWTPSRRRSGSERQVVLVHGLGGSALSWEAVGRRLADRLGATVTALDLVGFGRTRAPDRSATLRTNERLVTAVLEGRGPAAIVGNSMGATIGIGLTARRPDLVDALVLVNPAAPVTRPGVADWVRLARLAPVMLPPIGRRVVGTRARLLGPERLVDSTLAWCLDDPTRVDPSLRRRLIALAAERFAYPEAPAAYADAARSLLVYLAREMAADLARAVTNRPILLVHGARDRLVPVAAALAMGSRHDAITIEVLDDIGHAPQLEAPDRLVDTVGGWLERSVFATTVEGARSSGS